MGAISYLLDTHTFLWTVRGSKNLSDIAIKIIEDPSVTIFVSAASAYEIMNKYRIGKLSEFEDVAKNYYNFIKKLRAESLPITAQHAYLAGEFEWAHRDPFDRLLAAQAAVNNLTLITNDPMFLELSWIKVLW